MDKEKILSALQTIKDVCTEQVEGVDICNNCPLGDGGGGCKISDEIPKHWRIGPTEVWRAFN